ncbi:hypothetical protein [Paenibacillus sp. WC2504]|uniref:hypothetical protein n=1 Tax=Paenibacillus sp. WC2504 TaxID=3461403 RepID=UPI0040463CF9
MTASIYKRCVTDDDLAKVSLFILENRRDMHPSYSATDTITMLYSFIKYGQLIQVVDQNVQRIIAVSAYYIGTPEHDYEDKHIAFVEMAIADRAYRGSRLFIKGLRFLVSEIMSDNPDVQEVRFAALADNVYLCRLYAKFADISHEEDSILGKQMKFGVKINNLRAFLDKFVKV